MSAGPRRVRSRTHWNTLGKQSHSDHLLQAVQEPDPSVVLKVLWAAALLAAVAAFAHGQMAVPAKQSHPPHVLPLTKFYDTTNPLPPGKPGGLIRFEPLNDYELPLAVSAVRILYHSRSAKGKDIAVSGVVLVPPGAPPVGGWPVIAWAHDFRGAARQCAPSLMKNLSAGPFLTMHVNLGYAVVVTDYAGLGTNFPYAALDMQSSALDVIYSVPAPAPRCPNLEQGGWPWDIPREVSLLWEWPRLRTKSAMATTSVPSRFQALPTRAISTSDCPLVLPAAFLFPWHAASRTSFLIFESRTC